MSLVISRFNDPPKKESRLSMNFVRIVNKVAGTIAVDIVLEAPQTEKIARRKTHIEN